jgi:hypothetical protein
MLRFVDLLKAVDTINERKPRPINPAATLRQELLKLLRDVGFGDTFPDVAEDIVLIFFCNE